MKNKKIKLSELIESPITGEWGKEIGKSENPNTVKVIRTTNFTNSGEINYSNITLRDIESQKCEKKRLKYGDIILEKSGGTDLNPVGRVVFFDKDDTNDIYLTNNFTTILRVKDKRINSKFLLLFLLYNYKYRGLHKFYNKTTGIQNLQVSNFINQVFVPLPEIEIQNKIIKVLENIRTVIKKQKEQLELLENLKKSQFFELFGDPIKNDKDWKKVKLSDVAKIIMGQSPPSSSYNEKGIGMPFYQGNVDFGEKYPKIKKYTDKITKIANENTILMSVRAPVGELNVTKIECCIGRGVCSIKINGELNLEYLFYYLKNIMINIKKLEKGSTFKSINKKEIENIEVLLPPLELQNKFATRIEAIQKLKFEIEKSLKETENLYNSLMQKFFSNK